MIKSLYKKFQSWSATGSIWIISDTHFEDKDCKLMDKDWLSPLDQISQINKYVFPSDTFICLGDCGNEEWFELVRAKNKVLLLGNHDGGVSRYEKYFDEIYSGPLFIADRIILSHEPVLTTFAVNIHGHDHNGKLVNDGCCRHINVAANVCDYTPINLGKLIKDGLLTGIPSIHRETINEAIAIKQTKVDMKNEMLNSN